MDGIERYKLHTLPFRVFSQTRNATLRTKRHTASPSLEPQQNTERGWDNEKSSPPSAKRVGAACEWRVGAACEWR
eukprot:5566817-Pleurochrysis_carterae.AAC.1